MAIKIDLDLKITLGLTIASLFFVMVPPFNGSPLRIPLGLIMVLFIPGYSLIAALFTKKGDLDGIERAALSFGLSIAITPLIGLILNYTPFGIRLTPIATALTIFIVLMSAVAIYRRGTLDESERFRFDVKRGGLKDEVGWKKGSKSDRILTVVLVIAIISSIGALAYVISKPKQGERFTQFYILGEGMKAEGYPSVLGIGETTLVNVGIENNEYTTINYTVILKTGDAMLAKRSMLLEHGQNVTYPQTFSIPEKGENQKVEFLLYKNESGNTPYRSLHLWITVE